VYLRDFAGHERTSSYLELNQQFSHIAGVHWVSERQAYCALDDTGSFLDVVSISRQGPWHICAISEGALNLYLFVTNQVLIRVFDVTRYRDWSEFHQQKPQEELILRDELGLFARRVLSGRKQGPAAGYVRGAQVIRNTESPERMLRRLRGYPVEGKQFATFIVNDWKNDLVREWSCDPAQLGNYFTPSDLPYEISPVFFRPDVLLKYKQDPHRYALGQRAISCRGSWHLEVYDINAAGQVFTYIKYLGHLPFTEQLYWKSFNEAPKGALPERAIACVNGH
jgi:hypothetical protein